MSHHHPTHKKLFSKLGQDRQVSETVRLGLLLALSGGLMDAYSYLFRGEVFANAQTGNILLFSVNLSQGNWGVVKEYGCPVLAFGAGIALAFLIRQHFQRRNIRLHWRQIGVLIEIGVLIFVAFQPQTRNLLANSLTSLACGFQVEAFRKIHGNSIATTMCIGNFRAGLHALGEYWFSRKRSDRNKALTYFIVIAFFALGAVLGSHLIARMGQWAILCSSALLAACFLLMFIQTEEEKRDAL